MSSQSNVSDLNNNVTSSSGMETSIIVLLDKCSPEEYERVVKYIRSKQPATSVVETVKDAVIRCNDTSQLNEIVKVSRDRLTELTKNGSIMDGVTRTFVKSRLLDYIELCDEIIKKFICNPSNSQRILTISDDYIRNLICTYYRSKGYNCVCGGHDIFIKLNDLTHDMVDEEFLKITTNK